jgi:DNA-binding transcriptional LysR family regulator
LEEGSFVRAADRLHTTHSTISRSLKALSSGLGINLFDKTPHGLKPSSVGWVYGAQIRRSLEQAKLAFDLARYETNLHRQSLYVGRSPYIHSGLLPVLEQLTLPGSEALPIALRSATTTQLTWRVLRGELQAGFGVLPIVDKARPGKQAFNACRIDLPLP